MEKKINICYIDDKPETQLSRFLKSNYLNKANREGVITNYSEYHFSNKDDYKILLRSDKVKYSNVIIIDSKLFEESNSPNFRFTGEQFKVILKQLYPYIKTIVISQNDPAPSKIMISKFKSSSNLEKSEDYYQRVLKPHIEENINLILEEMFVIDELKKESGIDDILLDGITHSFQGLLEYSEFEKNELNNLIKLFQDVKNHYEQK